MEENFFYTFYKRGSRILELKVSRTQEKAILEKLHWRTHFRFRENNFAWSPSTNQTIYVCFCKLYSPFQKIIRLWWCSCTEPFDYHIKRRRCNQLQCTTDDHKNWSRQRPTIFPSVPVSVMPPLWTIAGVSKPSIVTGVPSGSESPGVSEEPYKVTCCYKQKEQITLMYSIKINLFNSDKFMAHVNKNHNVQSQGYQNLLKASRNWIKMLVRSSFWCTKMFCHGLILSIKSIKLQHLIKITGKN